MLRQLTPNFLYLNMFLHSVDLLFQCGYDQFTFQCSCYQILFAAVSRLGDHFHLTPEAEQSIFLAISEYDIP